MYLAAKQFKKLIGRKNSNKNADFGVSLWFLEQLQVYSVLLLLFQNHNSVFFFQ